MDEIVVRKRNRPSLVCEPCKRRKVKCDKGRPCTSCSKNGFAHKCTYIPNVLADKKKGAKSAKSRKLGPSAVVHNLTSDTESNTSGSGLFSTPHLGSNIATYGNGGQPEAAGSGASHKDPMVLVSSSELNALKERLHKLENDLQRIPSKNKNEFSSKISHTPEDPDSTDLFSVSYKELNINVDKNSRTIVLNQYVYDATIREESSYKLKDTFGYLENMIIPSPENVNGTPPTFSYKSATEKTLGSSSTSPTSFQQSDFRSDELASPAYIMGVNPYASSDDSINFYENYTSVVLNESSRRTNYGPFSWAAILKKDKILNLLKTYMQKQRKEGDHKLKDISDDDNENRESFEKKELESDGVVDLMPYKGDLRKDASSSAEALLSMKGDVNQLNSTGSFDSSSGGTFSSLPSSNRRRGPTLVRKPQLKESDTTVLLGINDIKLDNELKLISHIESILPKQRVLWLLIHRFFSFIYPFLPYIDERDFRHEMSRILGPEDYKDRKILHLNISKRLDFAYLGMLLIFIRFSYLSVASKHSRFRVEPALSQNCEYLLTNPIDTGVIDVAKSCINQFQIMRKFNFTVFQATFFLRMYHVYAPEEGDGADGGDSMVFNGMLVQMAYSVGIHREPANFKDDTFNDERANLLGRKMWHHILVHDFVDSYTFGTPMATSELFYDAKIPYLIPGVNENVFDTALESATVDFQCNGEALLNGPMKYILKLALNVRRKVKMSELTKHLNFLEICTFNAFGRTGDYITYLEDKDIGFRFSKAHKLKITLSLKSFYLSLFYHFFLHYEESGHQVLMFFYLKKMLTISICEIIPFLFPIILGTYDFFEDSVDLFINPIFLQMLHRTSEINIAAIVRTNMVIYELNTDPNHELKLRTNEEYKTFYNMNCLLVEYMEKCARVCISALTELSDKYYYAWGAARSQSFIYKIVTKDDFYIESARQNPKKARKLTLAQIEELILIYGRPLELAEKIVNEHCAIEKISNLFKKKLHETGKGTSKQTTPVGVVSSGVSLTTIPPALTAHNKLLNLNNKHWDNVPRMSYSPIPETPSFVRSYSNVITSEFEDLAFSNAAEIDSLWLQMLTSKNDNNNKVVTRETSTFTDSTRYDLALHANSNVTNNTNSTTSDNNSFNYSQDQLKLNSQQQMLGNNTPSFSNHNHTFNINHALLDSKLNLNFEDSTHFNFFSDLPLDKIFQNNM